jgi:hypothetical protein
MPKNKTKTPEEIKKIKESNCYNCTHFSGLIKPQRYDETTCIYGFCFKDMSEEHDGYPVYLPNGYCKKHKEKQENGE